MWRSFSVASLGLTLLSPIAAAQPAPPPMPQSAGMDNRQGADQYVQADVSCRRSAAVRSGYRAPDEAAGATTDGKAQQRYAADYYACMSAENGGPPALQNGYAPDGYIYGSSPPSNGFGPDGYAYGSSPPPNGYGPDGYAYGPPPPPPYYGGTPYPYPYYYPPYYGPAVTFGFGFGGFHGGGRR